MESVVDGLVADFYDPDSSHELERLGALWLVRVIASLLMNPAEGERQERALVGNFAVPARRAKRDLEG